MPVPRRPAPEPAESDIVTVVTVGTVLWAVALVLALAFHGTLEEHGNGAWVWIALAGFLLGLLGLQHVRRRAARLRDGAD